MREEVPYASMLYCLPSPSSARKRGDWREHLYALTNVDTDALEDDLLGVYWVNRRGLTDRSA
jgi:hypothetical protein